METLSKATRPKQHGFTLLEVMVALVIFSIGLLGLAGLQSQSMRFNNSAYYRTQATYLAYDILDRMRANKDTALSGSYDTAIADVPSATSCNGVGASCTDGTMASADIYEWKNGINSSQGLSMLPNGKGSISRDTSSAGTVFIITVQWDSTLSATGTSSVIVRGEL